MYIVTNQTKQTITRAAIEFKPGENRFRQGDLSAAKLAQIDADARLKWVNVDDTKQVDEKAPAKSVAK
ncbi:MAG: hypothetical protein Alis3KO_00990 [Aliiglaciecola sp.]